jgi:predicted branched-subunit amino acid permease
LINARYVVMGIALNDSLRGSRLWRAVQAQVLVDASFVVAYRGAGLFDIVRMAGASVPQWLGWVAGTAVGVLTRPSSDLLHDTGADVIFPAFFLVLLMEEVRRSRRALFSALCGAVIAGAMLLVTEPGYALLAATAGALVGLLPGDPVGSGRDQGSSRDEALGRDEASGRDEALGRDEASGADADGTPGSSA